MDVLLATIPTSHVMGSVPVIRAQFARVFYLWYRYFIVFCRWEVYITSLSQQALSWPQAFLYHAA